MAVLWSLFSRELSVGQVLSLSLLWRGHDCRTWAVVSASSPQGQRADFSMPMNLFHVATQSVVACSQPEYHGLFVAR